jgi:hypothetical protein
MLALVECRPWLGGNQVAPPQNNNDGDDDCRRHQPQRNYYQPWAIGKRVEAANAPSVPVRSPVAKRRLPRVRLLFLRSMCNVHYFRSTMSQCTRVSQFIFSHTKIKKRSSNKLHNALPIATLLAEKNYKHGE